MKKILTLILALSLLLCSTLALAGCNKDKDDENTLVCGITIIPGLNEQDADGNWIGFESEFAMAVGEILGMEVKFQEITWSQKFSELNSGSIDCVWNGFTANAEENGIKRSDLCDFSYGYMLNQQCVVVKTSNLDSYKTEADLAGKSCCVEGGSAGDTYVQDVNASEIVKTDAQINAFTEVKSGAVQYAVVDIVLAQNVCGKGNYQDLSIVTDIQLDSEIYAVGFKKGSDLTAKINAAIEQLYENGKLMEIATKYGFENVIQITKEIK